MMFVLKDLVLLSFMQVIKKTNTVKTDILISIQMLILCSLNAEMFFVVLKMTVRSNNVWMTRFIPTIVIVSSMYFITMWELSVQPYKTIIISWMSNVMVTNVLTMNLAVLLTVIALFMFLFVMMFILLCEIRLNTVKISVIQIFQQTIQESENTTSSKSTTFKQRF